MVNRERDYSKGMIYKIICNDPSVKQCYYGSTINFRKRKSKHKTACNKETYRGYNTFKYKFIRDNGGWENWSMVLVEHYPCNSKLELESRERHYIINNTEVLNIYKPVRTEQERLNYNASYCKKYYEKNKDRLKDKGKKYYEKNKDRLKDKGKKYYEKNKDRIKNKNYCHVREGLLLETY